MMRATGYTSLHDFRQHYPMETEKPMSGPNYGWYQVRFHVLAREIFDEGGEAALSRLWAFGPTRSRSSRFVADELFSRTPHLGLVRASTSKGPCAKARVGGESASGPSHRDLGLKQEPLLESWLSGTALDRFAYYGSRGEAAGVAGGDQSRAHCAEADV
jgi:hypothetical protein